MSNDPQFHLQAHLDSLYAGAPRRMAFTARDRDSFKTWQTVLRGEVKALLGIAGRVPPRQPQATLLDRMAREGYTEEKYALDVGEDVATPIYVLVPDSPPPYKTIMVFHGHNPSVQYVLGNYPDEETAAEMRAVDNNYAQALAQAGYLVCTVEQRGFGERKTDQIKDAGFPVSCRHLAFAYMMQGRTVLGERIWDGMVAISYMRGRDDVVPGALGATGNSGGGTTTLWLAALDERVTVSIPSCYLCSFKDSILGVYHCECNYVPGILELAEMGDLAALIAPRPFRAIAGEQDDIFPIAGVRQQFETVARAYDLLGVGERASLTVHPGGHAYNHAMSQEWFAQWL